MFRSMAFRDPASLTMSAPQATSFYLLIHSDPYSNPPKVEMKHLESKLTIRMPCADDRSDICRVILDPLNYQKEWPWAAMTFKEAEGWIDSFANPKSTSPRLWFVVESEEPVRKSHIIGMCGLAHIGNIRGPKDEDLLYAELSICITHEESKLGCGYVALRCIADYTLRMLDVSEVRFRASPKNLAFEKLIAKFADVVELSQKNESTRYLTWTIRRQTWLAKAPYLQDYYSQKQSERCEDGRKPMRVVKGKLIHELVPRKS